MVTTSTQTIPLRILHLNSSLRGGGTDDHCAKLALALHQLGQTVWIAGRDGREISKVIRSLKIPFQATPREGPLKLRFILSAAGFIRRERIQIVHGHHGQDIWPTILAARLSGAKPRVVLTRHLAKSPASIFSRKFMLGQCDAVIAVSGFVAKVLRDGAYEPRSPEPERRARPPVRGDHSKIHVIHGGIDTGRFRPGDSADLRREWGLEPGHFAFAVVGTYDFPRGKGQREFLEAAAQIHDRLPNARFLIIGRGSMADILRFDIDRLGLQGKVWLTPYCRDMPQAMNAIDCLVHPQVGTEAFGLVVLEAFACGRPVIASALDGIPEAFAAGGYGQLIMPESVVDLASAMVDCAGRPRPTSADRDALHRRVEKGYSISALGQRTLQFYRQLSGLQGP